MVSQLREPLHLGGEDVIGSSDLPLLMTIREAAEVLRIGQTKLTQLSLQKPPAVESIRVGRKRLYPRKAILAFIDRELEKVHG